MKTTKMKNTREEYLLSVIERMLYNGGLRMLDKVHDIPGFKLGINHDVEGPKLKIEKVA
jgi:hypothetical protein